jgi:hypothetical protein
MTEFSNPAIRIKGAFAILRCIAVWRISIGDVAIQNISVSNIAIRRVTIGVIAILDFFTKSAWG